MIGTPNIRIKMLIPFIIISPIDPIIQSFYKRYINRSIGYARKRVLKILIFCIQDDEWIRQCPIGNVDEITRLIVRNIKRAIEI